MTQTWPCGTAKSLNNAFTIPLPATAKELAEAEAKRIRNKKRYEQKLASQGRTRADLQKKATRVNPESHIGKGKTNSERAPR